MFDRLGATYDEDQLVVRARHRDPAQVVAKTITVEIASRSSRALLRYWGERYIHDTEMELPFLLKSLKIEPEEFWRVYEEVIAERGSARP